MTVQTAIVMEFQWQRPNYSEVGVPTFLFILPYQFINFFLQYLQKNVNNHRKIHLIFLNTYLQKVTNCRGMNPQYTRRYYAGADLKINF